MLVRSRRHPGLASHGIGGDQLDSQQSRPLCEPARSYHVRIVCAMLERPCGRVGASKRDNYPAYRDSRDPREYFVPDPTKFRVPVPIPKIFT